MSYAAKFFIAGRQGTIHERCITFPDAWLATELDARLSCRHRRRIPGYGPERPDCFFYL